MNLAEYWGVLILLLLGAGTGVGAIAATHLLGARRVYPRKSLPHECGIPSAGAENQRFSVKFYPVAVFFILFDIETIFMVPWALTFEKWKAQGDVMYAFVIGIIFLVILTLGLIYEWRKGLLDWNR